MAGVGIQERDPSDGDSWCLNLRIQEVAQLVQRDYTIG